MLLPTLFALTLAAAPATIEDGEALAAKRGVVLTDKAENSEQKIAPRCFDYKAGAVKVGICQFHTPAAAKKWKELTESTPFDSATRLVHGAVMFQVGGATDAERQKVITALK